ncbi:MAG: DUF1801 domain-containing protein [Streptococcaceae bacterium]|jgi:hypothetical protein|nr:DUF1801 domain-containing protein [Streptococcaceae bacterium]
MFKVDANSRESYLLAAGERKSDLEKLDAFIQTSAPKLSAYFHPGTALGQPGMRVKLLAYGETFYLSSSGKKVEWPVIAVALQKNYISVYVWSAVSIADFIGKLGECKVGKRNNFSFVKFSDLKLGPLEKLLETAENYFVTLNETSNEKEDEI